MDHSNENFIKAIERLSGEAFWLNTYQAAILGMEIDAIGLDFFRVTLNALQDARLVRLIRVLENKSNVASIWYVKRSNEALVNKCAKVADFNFSSATTLSEKLPGIRTGTIMHIDKDRILDTRKIYDLAGVTHQEVDNFIKSFWCLMKLIHLEVLGKEVECSSYDGSDIKYLANLRDQDIRNSGGTLLN